jgi:hypothetical protein
LGFRKKRKNSFYTVCFPHPAQHSRDSGCMVFLPKISDLSGWMAPTCLYSHRPVCAKGHPQVSTALAMAQLELLPNPGWRPSAASSAQVQDRKQAFEGMATPAWAPGGLKSVPVLGRVCAMGLGSRTQQTPGSPHHSISEG